ncbi:hypothetical protein [Marivita hallyeonensis]|nr:hypothetical protein [Marivita hallyeonensis]
MTLLLIGTSGIPEARADVRINTTNGVAYFHVLVSLTRGDLLPNPDTRDDDLAYTLSDGGMFEVYIPPDRLPGVSAPGCDLVILRMPWTSPDADPSYIDEKAALLQEILSVRDGDSEEVEVAVELNPYVETSNGTYSLTQCNAFFRTAFERYVPNVEPLTR